MGLLDRLFKRRKKEGVPEKEEGEKTELEVVCADDPEALEALRDVMFLDPRRINVSEEEAAAKAKEFEDAGDHFRAWVWYKIAGGLAIYHGDMGKVKQYFGRCAKLRPDASLKILEIPDRAVKKAQEYYARYLESAEEK